MDLRLTLADLRRLASPVARLFAFRARRAPVAHVDGLVEFVRTRAAFVSQTTLYGYLKTRMGMKFAQLFLDDVFSAAIATAARRVFVACLADLTVFAVALAGRRGRLERSDMAALARHCFATAIARTWEEEHSAPSRAEDGLDIDTAIAAFVERLEATDWETASHGETAFSHSPSELVAAAPVIDEFKDLDRGIVMNSIRFRWRDVREQLRKLLRAEPLCEDWRQSPRRARVMRS